MVKVQRPGLKELFDIDLKNVRQLVSGCWRASFLGIQLHRQFPLLLSFQTMLFEAYSHPSLKDGLKMRTVLPRLLVGASSSPRNHSFMPVSCVSSSGLCHVVGSRIVSLKMLSSAAPYGQSSAAPTA